VTSELTNKVDKATKDFRDRAKKIKNKNPTTSQEQNIDPDVWKSGRKVSGRPNYMKKIGKNTINVPLQKICPLGKANELAEDIFSHYEDMERYIPLCSTPNSFRVALTLHSGNPITKHHIQKLTQLGGLPHLTNRDTSKAGKQVKVEKPGTEEVMFMPKTPGVIAGPGGRLIKFVRHNPGNYADEMDQFNRFSYQPPESDYVKTLTYRWMEKLSESLGIPFFIIVVTWFEYRVNDKINHVLFTVPAKIISENYKDLNKDLHKPLELELATQEEFDSFFQLIGILKDAKPEVDTRHPLPDEINRAWSFEKVRSGPNGKKIKRFAKQKGFRCPGDNSFPEGSHCGHKQFSEFPDDEIDFGHIIFQDWADTYTVLKTLSDYPDNLYLTCGDCNSQVGGNFPEKRLRKRIESEKATIGDWLRNWPLLTSD